MEKEEFYSLTLDEIDSLHEAFCRKEKQRQIEEDLRIGRSTAALINFIGSALSKKNKPISALDIFPEHKQKEKSIEVVAKKPKKSVGVVALQAFIKAQVAADNKRKLEAARQRILEHGRKT